MPCSPSVRYGPMAQATGTVERRSLRLTPAAAVTIVGTVVGLVVAKQVFVAAHRPLSWAAAAIVAAVVLDPVVDRLATYIRRVPAVLVTFLVLGAVGVGTTYLVFDEIQGALDRLRVVAPDAAASIEERDDGLGDVARDFDLSTRVTSLVDALDERVTGGDDVLRTTAGTAPTYLVSSILTIFLMTYGPRMAHAALQQDPDEARRGRVADMVGPAVAKARAAVLLTVGLAVTAGLLGGLTAAALDLPAPSAVGFAVAVFTILPHAGLVIGSLPLLLLTLAFRSGTAALVLLVAVLGLQALDSLEVRPWVARRSVAIGLFIPWVVALIAYSVYGVGAAAYGLAYAVFGLALLDRLAERNPAVPDR